MESLHTVPIKICLSPKQKHTKLTWWLLELPWYNALWILPDWRKKLPWNNTVLCETFPLLVEKTSVIWNLVTPFSDWWWKTSVMYYCVKPFSDWWRKLPWYNTFWSRPVIGNENFHENFVKPFSDLRWKLLWSNTLWSLLVTDGENLHDRILCECFQWSAVKPSGI